VVNNSIYGNMNPRKIPTILDQNGKQ